MAGASVRMSVDVTQFKQGMRDAQASVKTFDAALVNNEKQLRKSGDAETYMSTQATMLNGKLEAQRRAAKNAQQAMEAMQKQGVDPASKAFQDMQRAMIEAMNGALDTENEIKNLGSAAQKTAGDTDKLAGSMQSLNKKVSLDQVIGVLDKVTGTIERGAKKAIELGENLWSSIMGSAQWGDDIATQAMMAQMSIEDYQRVVNVAATQGETSTSSLIKSWKKVKMNLTSDSAEVEQAFAKLGISTHEVVDTGFGKAAGQTRDYMDVYWEIGNALMRMTDAAEQERLAQTLLGRSWQESIPMFMMGREAYEQALKEQDVVAEENVQNLATLNDTVISLEQQFTTLKNTVISELAEPLTKGAEAVGDLLHNLNEYLKTEQGQEMLERLGTAVEGLFEDLSNIDPDEVVSGFVGVFEQVIGGLEWLVENKQTVIDALKAIAIGWGAIKLTGGALQILKLVEGIQGLFGGGGGGTGTGTGSGGPDILTTGGAGGVLKFLSPALKAVAPYAAGAAISAGLFYAIAKGASANNYTFQGDYNAARYTDVDNAHQLQAAVRGILSSNDKNAQWQLGYLSAHAGSAQDLFDLFNYNDAKLGETNWLLNVGGTSPQMAAAVYSMYAHRFGGLNTETFNSLPAEWRSMLIGGQEAYGNIQASGGQMDYTWLLSGMRQYFEHYGTFNEEGEWTIPGLEESSSSMDAASEAMTAAAQALALLPSEVAAAVANVTLTVSLPEHANGLWSVPWDGYPAILHKGERVVPANQANNYNSNLYIDRMYMNNGMDAAALAAAMAAQNNRIRAGYGS